MEHAQAESQTLGLSLPIEGEGSLRRWVAGGVVDLLIVTLPYALLTGFGGLLIDWLVLGKDDPLGGRDLRISDLQVCGWALALFVYFVVCEARFATTPGKRLFHLRVVTTQGTAPSLRAVLLRNLFKVPVLVLPLLELITLLTIAVSEPHRRLGDYAAGTCVVRVGALYRWNAS
jgi:uncharacterized RDD family membrane protein YckC